jgi:hypothetical protein
MERAFILPEVKDGNAWRDKRPLRVKMSETAPPW